MENFIENFKSGDRSSKTGKPPKADNRWTLLFIGNHGKTITLKRFKGMVILTCLILIISIAITAGLLYLSLNYRHEKNQLEFDLQDLKAQIKAIRYEKDVLMTKLVLAESRSKADAADKPQKQSESEISHQQTSDSAANKHSTQTATVKDEPRVENKSGPSSADSQPNSNLSVAIENFNVFPEPDKNLLRVQFKIKNTSYNSQHVAGHAIVVLKGEPLQQNKWLTIPRMSLSNGKPTGRQKGYAFGINHFKTMRFKANLPKSPELYQSATVFIFTRTGDLLLENNYSVNISSAPPATASKPLVKPSDQSTPTSSSRSSSRSHAGPAAPALLKPPATSTATPPSATTAPPISPEESVNPLKNSTTE